MASRFVNVSGYEPNLSPMILIANQIGFAPVKLLGKEIEPVTVAKDLGVMIDSSLSYNEHVTKTVSNCIYRLIRINRIKHLLDRRRYFY